MTVIDDDIRDIIQTMPVGAINVEPMMVPATVEPNKPMENWRTWYPTWQHSQAQAPEQIGNCYKMTTEYLLTIHQPYPGDKIKGKWTQGCSPYNQFTVKQTLRDANRFRIIDCLKDFECTISKSQLGNPKFNLRHWYARKRAHALQLWKPATKEYC